MKLKITYKDGTIEEREFDKDIISINQHNLKSINKIIDRKHIKVLTINTFPGLTYEYIGIVRNNIVKIGDLDYICNEDVIMEKPIFEGKMVDDMKIMPTNKISFRYATQQEIIYYLIKANLI